MTTEEIRLELERMGYYVDSYKPGYQRLYRVEKVGKYGAVEKTLSQFMTAAELKAWFIGFTRR